MSLILLTGERGIPDVWNEDHAFISVYLPKNISLHLALPVTKFSHPISSLFLKPLSALSALNKKPPELQTKFPPSYIHIFSPYTTTIYWSDVPNSNLHFQSLKTSITVHVYANILAYWSLNLIIIGRISILSTRDDYLNSFSRLAAVSRHCTFIIAAFFDPSF